MRNLLMIPSSRKLRLEPKESNRCGVEIHINNGLLMCKSEKSQLRLRKRRMLRKIKKKRKPILNQRVTKKRMRKNQKKLKKREMQKKKNLTKKKRRKKKKKSQTKTLKKQNKLPKKKKQPTKLLTAKSKSPLKKLEVRLKPLLHLKKQEKPTSQQTFKTCTTRTLKQL